MLCKGIRNYSTGMWDITITLVIVCPELEDKLYGHPSYYIISYYLKHRFWGFYDVITYLLGNSNLKTLIHTVYPVVHTNAATYGTHTNITQTLLTLAHLFSDVFHVLQTQDNKELCLQVAKRIERSHSLSLKPNSQHFSLCPEAL